MSVWLFRRSLPLVVRLRVPARNRSAVQTPKEPEQEAKFSETEAYTKWKARYNFEEEEEDTRPPSQRYFVLASWAAFMIYFCILREENDIDERIYQPVWKTVPELEVPLFEAAVIQHKRLNLPTAELEAHLKEALERQKSQEAKQAKG